MKLFGTTSVILLIGMTEVVPFFSDFFCFNFVRNFGPISSVSALIYLNDKESLIYLNIYLTSDVEDITKNLWNLFQSRSRIPRNPRNPRTG